MGNQASEMVQPLVTVDVDPHLDWLMDGPSFADLDQADHQN